MRARNPKLYRWTALVALVVLAAGLAGCAQSSMTTQTCVTSQSRPQADQMVLEAVAQQQGNDVTFVAQGEDCPINYDYAQGFCTGGNEFGRAAQSGACSPYMEGQRPVCEAVYLNAVVRDFPASPTPVTLAPGQLQVTMGLVGQAAAFTTAELQVTEAKAHWNKDQPVLFFRAAPRGGSAPAAPGSVQALSPVCQMEATLKARIDPERSRQLQAQQLNAKH